MGQILALVALIAGLQNPTDKAFVRAMAVTAWDTPNWQCLNVLITRESGWRLHADNPRSTAHGLYQVLRTNPKASRERQTIAAFRYIRHRYGNPCRALKHSLKRGWY